MGRNMIQSKSFRGIAGDKWLLKLEKKAFGWHYWSLQNEHEYGYEISSDGTSGHTTHKIIQWLEFRRQAPYTRNFLFNLTEFFSKIFSFIRRLLIPIGSPILILSLILGIVMLAGCNEADMANICFTVAKVLAIAYASAIGGTLIFCGFGLLWRKVFKIDEKLKAIYGDDLETACTFADE
ncbi:MAG: hypothetical protein K2L72_06320 [Clostridia bacterium]|nr:hypothetical protein [Clostridia bacterium]